jgi:hypothetical protein
MKLYQYSLPYSTEQPMLLGVMLDGETIEVKGLTMVMRNNYVGHVTDNWHATKAAAYRAAADLLRAAAQKIEIEANRLGSLATAIERGEVTTTTGDQ